VWGSRASTWEGMRRRTALGRLRGPLLAAMASILGLPGQARGAPSIAPSGPFGAETVVEQARALAKAPFAAPEASLPAPLASSTYDQYRDIRFRPSATIWARPPRRFRLQLLPLGYLFTTATEIAIVEAGHPRPGVRPVGARSRHQDR